MCPVSKVNNANAPCPPNHHLFAVMACAHRHLEKNMNFWGQWVQERLEMLVCYPGEHVPDPRSPMAVELASGCGAALCSAPEPDVSKPSHTRAALPEPMGLRRIVVLSSTVSLWCQRDRHGVVVLDAEHVVTQTGKKV